MKRSLCLLLAVPALLLPSFAGSVRIYQTNSAGDHVDVIDPVTNTVVLKVEGIEVPHGVAFSPDGKRAYITCESESTLWATDTKTGKLIAKAPLSGHPNNLSVSNDGKYVFVGIAVAPGAVDVIDTASMKIAKSIPVKGAVHNTYVTPDGKFVIAGSVAGKMLTVIDEKTLAVAWELPMDNGVRPIAFEKAADGSTSRMFVQISNLHGFEVVDFKTHKVAQTITLPDQPVNGKAESAAPSHGIAVSPDGKTLWVNSSIASGIFEYSLPDLKVLGYVKTDKVPDWVTFTPDGKTVYVANSGVNMVSAVDVASRKEIARIPVGEVPKRNGTVVVP
jgi:YVTN family beta-propeller protein